MVRIDDETGLPLEVEDGRPALQARVSAPESAAPFHMRVPLRVWYQNVLFVAATAPALPLQSLANALKLCKKKLLKLKQDGVWTKEDMEHYQVFTAF